MSEVTPERRRRRLLTVSALAAAALVVAFLALGGIGESLVYYWSPSELLEARASARGATVRLGGLVVPGSIEREADGLTLHFAVSDGRQSVPVTARTVPPAMFREGVGVVVEGTLAADGTFTTQRLMVKHDNEYRAPGEGDEPDMDELVKTMRFEAES